jgi:hypothetical protein
MPTNLIRDTATVLRQQKELADRALAQVEDADFFAPLDREANCIAVIVKHLAGNLRSRWTDFLTTDGEKPDRGRDEEFIIGESDTRMALMDSWERGWTACIDAIEALTATDLVREVRIRGQPHTVTLAIQRSLAHTAHHVGQIVMLAKHAAGRRWKTLSIPRGESPRRQSPDRHEMPTDARSGFFPHESPRAARA